MAVVSQSFLAKSIMMNFADEEFFYVEGEPPEPISLSQPNATVIGLCKLSTRQ